ncbi:type II secretion system protein [Candidatus Roizmanbacteria bacterium]|nr:type II secretion system protein [Candidatus Roizmanbacteria bacterium]
MKSGQSLIEILLVVGLSAILLPALLTGLVTSRSGRAQYTQRLQAINLLKDGAEATRTIRDGGWTTFADYAYGIFHPETTSQSNWILVSGPETTSEGFTRQIEVSEVRRDARGAIVVTGGNVDPSTRKVVVRVSWLLPYSSSITSAFYLTRYWDNASYTETTQTQFNAGTKSGVTVQASIPNPTPTPDDGEVILASGGRSNWCKPSLDQNTLNLPKNGVGKAISAIQGQAFAGTGENSSGISFVNISITDTYPPEPAIEGTFDGYKTNGVFGENDYAYLATDNNHKEVVIIDLTQLNPDTNKYSELGYYNAPGNKSAQSVVVSGTIGFVTVDNNLYTFDVSSKSGSRPQLGNISLAGNGKKVFVFDTYAYVAIEDPTALQIIQF